MNNRELGLMNVRTSVANLWYKYIWPIPKNTMKSPYTEDVTVSRKQWDMPCSTHTSDIEILGGQYDILPKLDRKLSGIMWRLKNNEYSKFCDLKKYKNSGYSQLVSCTCIAYIGSI